MNCRNLRVVAGVDPALTFEHPAEALSAHSPVDAAAAFARAEEGLKQGYWVAGFLSYELGSAFVKLEPTHSDFPLLFLGLFDEPRESALIDAESADDRITPLLREVDRRSYGDATVEMLRRIYDGDAYQINYTVPFSFHASGELERIYALCARRTQAPYQAYVSAGNFEILSWSPELFLSFDGTGLTTRPMKGTARLDRVVQLSNEKNRAELLMIVDLLRNDLNRICDNVAVEEIFKVERFPTFAAMTATITGELRPGLSLLEIFRATFPCGSVTGAPKRSAMSIIAEHERRPREVYCGSIGFLSPQRRGWWNVAIRTAQYDRAKGIGRFDAGGAIVSDSMPNDEWSEIELKLRMLDGAIDPNFALLETFASSAAEETIEAHLQRLGNSARAFGIDFNVEELYRRVKAACVGANELIRVRLKADGSLRIVSEPPAVGSRDSARVCVSEARVWSGDPFLRHKTTWRPAHDAAAREAQAATCFDALLRNERGELTEGARTNLFVAKDGTLWTPPLSSGVLPGILRASLIGNGRAKERVLKIDDLFVADAVYVGNSARGLQPASVERLELPALAP